MDANGITQGGESAPADIMQEADERRFLRPKAAAAHLGCSQAWLCQLRARGKGPAYSRLGKNCVVYSLDDLTDWVAKHRQPTTEAA